MKRSEINAIIEEAIGFFREMNFSLPPFAYFSIDDWLKIKANAQEIIDLRLGWDVTDFGLGRFDTCGLLLFTIRNGKYKSKTYPKPFAEKIMIAKPGQVTPLHFHWDKMEDIINRAGGDLVFELYQSTKDENLADTPVHYVQDGISKVSTAGKPVILKPGESLTLPPYLYHKFYGQTSPVLIGEVSMVNDDARDNRFLDVGRFPEIEEDVSPVYLLCNDYQKFLEV
jgi:D-lyxose ketol-isomerase